MSKVIKPPERVILCGVGYKVTVVEECVIFTAEPGIAGCYTRLMFQRRAGCWYMEVKSDDGQAMVAHVEAAQYHLNIWYGKDHEFSRGEYRL
jgi:hypothetical protein